MIASNRPPSPPGHPAPGSPGKVRGQRTRTRRTATGGGRGPSRARHLHQRPQQSSFLGEVILTALFVLLLVILAYVFNSLARESWLFFKETVEEASIGTMLLAKSLGRI